MAGQSFGTQHRATKRTMGLMYIILSLLLNDEVHSVFEVMKYPDLFSWQRALHRCDDIRRNLTFAVPVVNLSSMTVLDKIDLQGEAWVGYFQTYEYFLFIVCVPLSEIESSVSARFNIGRHYNRPGMCYSLCGLQGYIGLQVGMHILQHFCLLNKLGIAADRANRPFLRRSTLLNDGFLQKRNNYVSNVKPKHLANKETFLRDDLCYCIETRSFSSPDIHSVNSSCENPLHCANGMLCGNLGYIKISVYKKVFISSNYMGDDDSGCLIVAKGREYKMSMASCTGRFQHLCESYAGQTIHLEESPTYDQWVYLSLNCAKTGKKPTTFIGNGTNFVFPIISGSRWTSVVRDLVIRNCSESMTIKGTTLYEGFLTNSNEGVKLEFVHARKYSRKQFVACMSEQPIIELENRTNAPAGTTITSAPSEAPTMSRIPERPSNEQENRTNEPAETTITSAPSEAPTMSLIPVLTVILPIGLAALALITVVALIIVCWRRRKEKATNNEEASKQKSTETVVPRNSETKQTLDKREKEALNQLEENEQGHVSSEYDSLKEYNAPFSAPTENLYDTSNFNIGDGTYAVTFSANTLRQVVQTNSYDHIIMKKTNDGKYDHVELQDQRNSVNDICTYAQGNALDCDNTYYETIQEKFKLHQQLEGNVYNTAHFSTL